MPTTGWVRIMKSVLPTRLAILRRGIPLTQRQLATRAGVAVGTVVSLESGQALGVDAFTLFRLATALGQTIDFLVGFDGVDPQTPSAIIQELHFPKCRDCSSLLNVTPHRLVDCLWANHQRQKNESWLAGHYGIDLVCVRLILERRGVASPSATEC